MDRITTSLLKEFSKEHGLDDLEEFKQFEHFGAYLLTSRHHTDSFVTEDICIGDGGDIGIDGLSIIINGCIVTEPEEVSDLFETNGYLDVTFILSKQKPQAHLTLQRLDNLALALSISFRKNLPYHKTMRLN